MEAALTQKIANSIAADPYSFFLLTMCWESITMGLGERPRSVHVSVGDSMVGACMALSGGVRDLCMRSESSRADTLRKIKKLRSHASGKGRAYFWVWQ